MALRPKRRAPQSLSRSGESVPSGRRNHPPQPPRPQAAADSSQDFNPAKGDFGVKKTVMCRFLAKISFVFGVPRGLAPLAARPPRRNGGAFLGSSFGDERRTPTKPNATNSTGNLKARQARADMESAPTSAAANAKPSHTRPPYSQVAGRRGRRPLRRRVLTVAKQPPRRRCGRAMRQNGRVTQRCVKNYRWIRPEPSPPASFSTSETVTML